MVYSTLANRLTVIYFCQWVVIPWAALLAPRPTTQASAWWGTLVILPVLAVSFAMSEVYRRAKLRFFNRVRLDQQQK